jgi:DNA-binding transcriptional MerR regulator
MEGRLHTIGEVAKLTGAPVKSIRYYSDIGLLPPAEVSDSRYRL